jgi:hypothetical protein
MRVSEGPARYADGFGALHHGHVTAATWQGQLPVTVQVELHVNGVVPQDAGPGAGQATKGDS